MQKGKVEVQGAARRWLEKEPHRSILTWEDLVSKFINEFFPPSRTTNIRNEISNFQQRFDELFHEACDRYKDLLRACPHHGFIELHQLDTFYNALNPTDQDSLNSAAGSNLFERRTQDVLTIIENKPKVRNSRIKLIVFQVKSSDANSSSSSEIAKLTHAVNHQTSDVTTIVTAILKQFQATPPPASVKVVEEIFVTCGGAHPYYQCLTADGNTFPEFQDNIQGYVSAAAVNYNQGPLPRNTIANPKGELKAITTQSGLVLDGPSLTFPSNFVIVDYESDPRVLLILGRPFLWTTHALIDVHGEEMILRDDDERSTLNMRHDTSSYLNQPHKESNNMINIYNDSYEDYLKDLFATNHLSGNPTFSSHTDLTSPKVINPLSGNPTSSSPDHLLEEEIEYFLNHDPTKEMDSILEDSVDEDNLADPNNDLFDTIPEMFTDEHTLDYSSPPLYDDFDDDI
nr:reverse transcriptase domain-containing protein [Tanacetum cinerariifolium]